MATATRTLVPSGGAADIDAVATSLAAEADITSASASFVGGKIKAITMLATAASVALAQTAADDAETAVGGVIELEGHPEVTVA